MGEDLDDTKPMKQMYSISMISVTSLFKICSEKQDASAVHLASEEMRRP